MKTKPLLVGLLLSSAAFAADKNPDDTIRSLETRVVALDGKGQYAEAVPLAKQVIELRRKKTGTKDPDYASALENLAVLDKSLGRFEEAQPLLEETLAIRRAVLKPTDPLILATLGSLAEIYGDEGKPEQAEPLLREAAAKGAVSLEIANGAETVGVAYLQQSQFDPAIPLLQQGLDGYRKLYPANHPKVTAATANLAKAFIGAGRPDQAEPLLKLSSDSSGGGDQAEIDALTRQSDFYVAQKRADEAASPLKRVLELRRKLGTEDKNLAARVGNLAALYANSGHSAEAVPWWQENIAIFEKIGGPDSVAVAGGLDNLAIVYMNQTDVDSAEPLIQRSAAIYLKALGETSPQYMTAQDRLAKIAEHRKALGAQQPK